MLAVAGLTTKAVRLGLAIEVLVDTGFAHEGLPLVRSLIEAQVFLWVLERNDSTLAARYLLVAEHSLEKNAGESEYKKIVAKRRGPDFKKDAIGIVGHDVWKQILDAQLKWIPRENNHDELISSGSALRDSGVVGGRETIFNTASNSLHALDALDYLDWTVTDEHLHVTLRDTGDAPMVLFSTSTFLVRALESLGRIGGVDTDAILKGPSDVLNKYMNDAAAELAAGNGPS